MAKARSRFLSHDESFPTSEGKERGRHITSDWEAMVKDFEGLSTRSKSFILETIPRDVEKVEFGTGSSYTGKWNLLGMTVNGVYKYPQGCTYDGAFEDGVFHGEGTLLYPMGQKLQAYWENGVLISYKFSNVDGLDYEPNWEYCKMPDRRFNVTFRKGLQPAGREHLTNQQPERQILPGCYDTADGFYNPNNRCITTARDPEEYKHLDLKEEAESTISSVTTDSRELTEEQDFWINAATMVSERRHHWIITNCRKEWDEASGYRPDCYEDWITGRKKEIEKLDKKYDKLKKKKLHKIYENTSLRYEAPPQAAACVMPRPFTGMKITRSGSCLGPVVNNLG